MRRLATDALRGDHESATGIGTEAELERLRDAVWRQAQPIS
jgi:hypothetical protein